MSPEETVTAVLAQLSGYPMQACRDTGLDLKRDVGVDSLLLAEMEVLQQQRRRT